MCVLDTGIYPHIDFRDRIIGFQDFVGKHMLPYDDNSHGTHVSGIIGGDGSASGGRIRGIAPECNLVALKILDRYGNGKKRDVLRAFDWILKNKDAYGIQVVNISIGTTCREKQDHRQLIEGVERLWDAGLVVVAAAGNQGPGQEVLQLPGSSRKIITVGSSDLLTGRTAISGRGATSECICKPDLVAPGNRILSCAPGTDFAYGVKAGLDVHTLSQRRCSPSSAKISYPYQCGNQKMPEGIGQRPGSASESAGLRRTGYETGIDERIYFR